MLTVSSVAVVVAYGALLSFVAVRARTAREFSEFSLAKRSLPLALVFGSLAAIAQQSFRPVALRRRISPGLPFSELAEPP